MKKTFESRKANVQEPVVRDWLRFELTEDDFLMGKKPAFYFDDWEGDE